MYKEVFFRFGNSEFLVAARRLNFFGKIKGLMLSNSSEILLFEFKKPTRISIHSFFCKKFLVIWIDEKNNVIDFKVVSPWKITIKPRKNFLKLIEIPFSDDNLDLIHFLVSSRRGRKV